MPIISVKRIRMSEDFPAVDDVTSTLSAEAPVSVEAPCPLPGLPCVPQSPGGSPCRFVSPSCVPVFESACEQEFVFCQAGRILCHHWQRKLFY